ncbi:hypothetical protein KAK06_15395 [Ideonella sp. 4Y11]|uniref:Uncharacterized protein n=1 Tax=Ideonella aquatica TaxID=2824119 RepID=A0A940YIY3_9BURK|nr:hypothetical protein [Ideonella aquatica]MBQ0960339.1 hypothetical protein [Ideonella aquatica]
MKAFAFRSARALLVESELEVTLPSLWREHSLPSLLKMADLVVRQLKPPAPSAIQHALPSAAEFIDQLHELDPGSYSFRYPVGTTGLPLFESTLRMNLLVFAQRADSALDELSGACIYLEERFISTTEIKLALAQLSEGGAR